MNLKRGEKETKSKRKSNIKEQDINTVLLKNRVFGLVKGLPPTPLTWLRGGSLRIPQPIVSPRPLESSSIHGYTPLAVRPQLPKKRTAIQYRWSNIPLSGS